MTPWTSLLEEHTAAAAPRAFDGVLRRVRRRRQRQVVGAALGVLLVVGGAALAVGTSTTTAHPQPAASGSPLPGIGKPPASILVDGKRLPRTNAVYPVHVVLVDDDSDAVLRIKTRAYADTEDLACGQAVRAFLLRQDDTSVRVGLYSYGSPRGCFESPASSGLRDLMVPLGAPLGSRTVSVDGAGAVPVLQTDTLLRAATLPQGFTRLDETVDVAPGQVDPYDTYRWSVHGVFVSLIQGVSAAGTGAAYPDSTEPVVVRGHQGSRQFSSRTDTVCLRWYEGRPVALCAAPGRGPRLPDLLAFAGTLASRSSAHDASLVPVTISIGGVSFTLVGDQPVEVVYATDRDDQLDIRAGQHTSSAECGPLTRSFVLSQDSTTVRIGTYFFLASGGGGGSCGGNVGVESDEVLQLKAPLGSRRVIAVTDFNRQVPVIDEHDFLTAGYLPAGFSGRTFVGGRTRLALGYARQTWQAESGQVSLTLDEGPLPGEVRVLGPVVGHLTAHGRAADVVQQRGTTYPVRCLRWAEGNDDGVQLCSHGGGQKHLLSDAELVRVADALHRP